jgi:two-component system response regulator
MRKILIVDDNPDDIEITKIVLEESGWELHVEACPSAEKALACLREPKDLPCSILLDLNIPGMGGIECLRRIRADESLKSIPVIIVTASSFDQDQKKAYDAGANFFLYKELDIDRYGENLYAALKRMMV